MKWLLVLLATTAFSAFGASADTFDQAALKGIKAVNVAVEYPQREYEPEGLTQQVVKRQIERRLEDAGMKVEADAPEFLALTISAFKMRRPPFAISMHLGLYQVAILARDRNTKTVAETWEADDVLLAHPKTLKDESLRVVDGLIAKFISAWKAANP